MKCLRSHKREKCSAINYSLNPKPGAGRDSTELKFGFKIYYLNPKP